MTFLMRRSDSPRTLRSEMDRLFDDFLGMTPVKNASHSMWAPAVDVREDNDSFFVTVDLPGMKKEDIDLELENNLLTIKGDRKFERSEESENYHFMERSYGSFYRSFTLPKNVKSDDIGAEYKDGVLTVSIPKAEKVKPKKVEIKW